MADSETVSDPKVVRNFIDGWSSEIDANLLLQVNEFNRHELIAKKMGISTDMLQELESVCSVAALDDETRMTLTDEQMLSTCPEDNTLTTVRYQKLDLASRATKSYRIKRRQRYRYRTDNGPQLHRMLATPELEGKEIAPEARIVEPEALLVVRLYKPYLNKNAQLPPCMSSHHVLGSTQLTQFRDVIKCPSDHLIVHDLSENPEKKVESSQEMFRGACFYIEGQFYDDDRNPTSTLLSSTIVDWALKPSVQVGPFSARSMQNVCFKDLTIRLGQPYLYMHQGNCEHLLVFSDLRMLARDESHDKSNYPLEVYYVSCTKTKCRACLMYLARWSVRNSEHCPEDPAFLCDTCFRAFHYDSDGRKIGQFKAYAIQRDV